MLKMGFDRKWVDIVMRYVRIVTYAVKINGESRGLITPTRGLCQGDSLSLYIYIYYLCRRLVDTNAFGLILKKDAKSINPA